jgi:hypothetical protein
MESALEILGDLDGVGALAENTEIEKPKQECFQKMSIAKLIDGT